MANTLGNLGNAHGGLGDHAKKRHSRSARSRSRSGCTAATSPEVANTLFNLAQAHGKLGDLPKRRELLERALPILKRAHGPDHPYTKGCQAFIADTLLGPSGANQATQPSSETCWSARSLSLKVSTARTAKKWPPRCFISRTHTRGLGDYAKAIDVLERTVAIEERAYGRDDPTVALRR